MPFIRKLRCSMTFTKGRTSELTRRREFTDASPDQLCYETRLRRSRPTICSAARFAATWVFYNYGFGALEELGKL
jgi:hypothetical protein